MNKICLICSTPFKATGPARKYCSPCAKEKARVAACVHSQNYKIKNGLVKNPGVGSGGANKRQSEDDQYKTGIAYFMKNRRRIKEERRYCEHCNKDLLEATRYHWVVHHKDHDRTNNVDSNFTLLCKRCHQLEHDCISAFTSRATTIPQGSRD